MVTAAKTATMNAAGTPTRRMESQRRGKSDGRIPGGGPGATCGAGGAHPDGPRPGMTGPDGPPGDLCVILSPTPAPRTRKSRKCAGAEPHAPAPVHGLVLDIVTPRPWQSSQSPGWRPHTPHREEPGAPSCPVDRKPVHPAGPLVIPHHQAGCRLRHVPDGNKNEWTAETVRSHAPSQPSSQLDLYEVRLILRFD